MKLIRTGFVRGDDQSTATPAELCRRNTGIYLEFLCSFHRREKENDVLQTVIVVDTVKDEVVRLRTGTVDRKFRPAILTVTV